MPSKSYPRSRRVAQQVQQALSELIRREVRDPRLGLVTLTEVRMSSDLSYATIYYSVLGADAQQAQGILDGAAGMLRGPLGRSLGIRHSPELRFVRDELIESGARLSALIQQAVREDVARHVDEPAEASGAPGEHESTSRPGEGAGAPENALGPGEPGPSGPDHSQPGHSEAGRSEPNHSVPGDAEPKSADRGRSTPHGGEPSGR